MRDEELSWLDDVFSKVNEERNSVAHRGEFRGQKKATEVMQHTEKSLLEILDLR